jgi:hypothetical protein
MNQRMNGVIGVYTCSACNRTHTFSERYPQEKVRRFLCPHFNLVFSMMRSFSASKIKMQIKSSCNLCYKEYSSEMKIGNLNFNNQPYTEDTYLSTCCGNKIEVVISLSEEYFDQNERTDVYYDVGTRNNNINFNFNNNNNLVNNAPINMNQIVMNNNNIINNNIGRIIPNMKNMDYLARFDKTNIVELSKKNKLVNFVEEKTNKNFKIYTANKLRLRTVLNDLLCLYPEINYNNNDLMINQIILSLNSTIESLNLNQNSAILIKNK